MRTIKLLSIAIVSMLIMSSQAVSWPVSNIIGSVKDYNPKLIDDFYANVNHEWLINAKLKPGRVRTGAFNELQDVIDERLKALMTDETVKGHDGELVRTLYALWLDWDSRNEEGIDDLNTQAKKITAITSINELSEYFKTKDSFYNGTVIADYVAGFDNIDSEAYNLEILATGLSLGDSAEYRKMTSNGERTKKMHDGIVMYMLRRLGYPESEAKKFLESSYEFEKAISESMMTVDELNAPEAIKKMYNPITMQELREKSKAFPFADIIEAHNANSKLICLEQPKWLEALNALYTPENLENIKAYLLCNLAGSYITITDEPAFREYQRLSRERYGITQSRPDDELAVNFVHSSLSVPVSRIYVSRYVPAEYKREVTEIINDTVKYYRNMLAGEEWLSEATRNKAIEKLDAMRLNVAYPDKWVDFSGLNIDSKKGLIEAVKAMRRYKTQKYFYERLNTRVDHDLWINDVVIVNSYYRPSENSINIIAGILGGEFYNSEMTYEEKLGGIGAVIGHEISHAFDTNGAQFDKNGSMKDWWTEEDYKKFQARADKLIKYFSAMKVNGENYNGALVQTESIADMAGIKAMLGIAENHKDFDYDKFFRSYARIWKTAETPEFVDVLIKTDVHALSFLRVNAIVQQYEKFYETYKIQKGAGMYLAPDERVAVW